MKEGDSVAGESCAGKAGGSYWPDKIPAPSLSSVRCDDEKCGRAAAVKRGQCGERVTCPKRRERRGESCWPGGEGEKGKSLSKVNKKT